MAEPDELSEANADRPIERGAPSVHVEHGRVEVTGSWQGINEVDSARNTNRTDVIIVRYSTERDRGSMDELTDTLDRFLEAIE